MIDHDRELSSRPRGAGSAQAILDAGLAALRDEGLDALTMSAVARRAGVSVGSLYNRFPDKNRLMIALHAAFVAHVVSVSADAEPNLDGSLRDVLRALIGGHCRLMSSNAALMRVFMHVTAVHPELASEAAAATQAVGRRFASQLLGAARGEITRSDPAFAADVCFVMVHDVLARRIARGGTFESDVELSWERLSEELAALCAAYLTVRSVGR